MENKTNPRLAALRHRDFRLFWTGRLLSVIGTQMQHVGINWHIYSLLRGETTAWHLFGRTIALNESALGLGLLGLVRVVPVILFGLLGGVLADTQDRRKLMIWVQVVAMITSGLLAVLTLTDRIGMVMIYALSAAGAATWAFDNPARNAVVANLVPREHLANAMSLNVLMFQIASMVGPALGGLLLSRYSVGWIYFIDALSFGAVILSVVLMEYRSVPSATKTDISWESFREGWRFTYNSRIIWGTMLLDFLATFFASARSMLPIVAADILHVGAQGYGLLSAAQSVGAFIAGGILAFRKEIYAQGKVLLASVAVFGLATAVFGVSTSFGLSYLMLALIGAGDTVSTVIRSTLRQLLTPDELRGRMTGVNMIFFAGGPQLGELEAGVAAALFGVPFAIISGGVATVLLTGWIAWQYPRLRVYTSETQPAGD